MSITRSQLIGKKVYNPDGGYAGEVLDIGFSLGESKITLVIKSKWGANVNVPWENVAAAKDIVILRKPISAPTEVSAIKPATAPASMPTVTAVEEREEEKKKKGFGLGIFKKEEGKEAKICPYCGKPATWIPQYRRWYCYNCQRYID